MPLLEWVTIGVPLGAASCALVVLSSGVAGRLTRRQEIRWLWLVFAVVALLVAFPISSQDLGAAIWVVVTSGVLVGFVLVMYLPIRRDGEMPSSFPYVVWLVVFAFWIVSLFFLFLYGMWH